MRILALECSGLAASAAIANDGVLIGEYTINYKKTHSQTLLPMIDEVARMTELDLNTIDVIAITSGPGSFTGLRIGSATAKGLGLALDKPICAVPTVDALAYNLWGAGALVCPLMDARRNQVYTGVYRFKDGEMLTILDQRAVSIDEILGELSEMGRNVIFLGDGVPVFEDQIKDKCRVPYMFAPAHMNRQRAGAVAALAFLYARDGKLESSDDHKPDYLRLSQAERERLEKEKYV